MQLWATADGDLTVGEDDVLLATLPNLPFFLQPGQTSTQTLDFTLPEEMNHATYQLATVIAPTEGLSNEIAADNTNIDAQVFNVEEPRGDLTVTADWPDAPYGENNNVFLHGETYTMQVTVTNSGNIAAGPFNTSLYCAAFNNDVAVDPDRLLGEFTLPALAAGETVIQTLTFQFPNALPSDNYNLEVITDSQEDIIETNETNNISSRALYFVV